MTNNIPLAPTNKEAIREWLVLVAVATLRCEFESWVRFVETSAVASKSFLVFLGFAEEDLESVSNPSLDTFPSSGRVPVPGGPVGWSEIKNYSHQKYSPRTSFFVIFFVL